MAGIWSKRENSARVATSHGYTVNWWLIDASSSTDEDFIVTSQRDPRRQISRRVSQIRSSLRAARISQTSLMADGVPSEYDTLPPDQVAVLAANGYLAPTDASRMKRILGGLDALVSELEADAWKDDRDWVEAVTLYHEISLSPGLSGFGVRLGKVIRHLAPTPHLRRLQADPTPAILNAASRHLSK